MAIKQKQILETTWQEYGKMSNSKLFDYAKRAATLAKRRRTSLVKNVLKENLPLPPSLQKWSTTKNIPDKFNAEVQGLSEITGYNNYDRGYGNVDFSVDTTMSRGELMHKIFLARSFIKAETSTIKGWKSYYNDIINRISEKGNIEILPEEYPNYWDLYNKIKEMARKGNKTLVDKFEHGKSTEIQQIIANYFVQGFSLDRAEELFEMLEERAVYDYESENEDDATWI